MDELISLIDRQIKITCKNLHNLSIGNDHNPELKIILQWSGSSFEFIELTKALFLSKSFNKGEITYKDLFETLSYIFNVSVSHPHVAYTKMRERTSDRTLFLTKLKNLINEDMDNKDSK